MEYIEKTVEYRVVPLPAFVKWFYLEKNVHLMKNWFLYYVSLVYLLLYEKSNVLISYFLPEVE